MSDTDHPDPDVDVPSITAAELREKLERHDNLNVLDLRSRDEFEEWSIEGEGVRTVNHHYSAYIEAEITDTVRAKFEESGLDEPVLAVCRYGGASAYVVDLFLKEGIDAMNLEDGTEAYRELDA
jgi:rhodanese-related sulfurtransferase